MGADDEKPGTHGKLEGEKITMGVFVGILLFVAVLVVLNCAFRGVKAMYGEGNDKKKD